MTFSNVQGGHAGVGNIDANPRFVDAPAGDYHLLAPSPSIGRGTSAGAPSTDFEGDPRPAFGQVDIGADEFFQHQYHFGNATRVNNKLISDHYLVWVRLGERRKSKRPALTAAASAPVTIANKRRKFTVSKTVNMTGSGLQSSLKKAKIYITTYSTARN